MNLDDSQDKIEWEDICDATHLDSNLSYKKLINEIDYYLQPKYNLYLNFDYESMKLLIQQAKDCKARFTTSNELMVLLISKCENDETKKKLYTDYIKTNGPEAFSILDLHMYKKLCRNITNDADLSIIEKYHKKIIGKKLDDYLTCLLIDLQQDVYIASQEYYYDEKNNLRDSSEPPKLFYLDLIADYFFDDYYENVVIDIMQILKYIALTNNNDIPKERIKFYHDFIELKKISQVKQREFYLNNKNVNMIESFYDDVRLLKNKSYQSLIDACTKFTKDSKLYNQELSNKHNCEVYYLDGEDFNAFVRSNVEINKYNICITDYKDNKPVFERVECSIPNKDSVNRLGSSFTYIGKENIQTYQNPNNKLTLLYRGIKPEYIGHIYHNDSWSAGAYGYYSDYANEIHTPDSLLNESTLYPEIFITNCDGIEPFALLCLDEITTWDEKFARAYNMPIVLINSSKYERKHEKQDLYDDRYVR